MIGRWLKAWSAGKPASPPGILDQPLLYLSDTDALTPRDLAGACLISGSPGVGKSSGPGRALIEAMLLHGFGGLVLCVKPGEASKIAQYCRNTGREDDLLRFSPEEPQWRINPLEVELKRTGRGGGFVHNALLVIDQLTELVEHGQSQGREENPYWRRAVRELATYCLDTLLLSGEIVSLPNINRLLQSIPRRTGGVDELASPEWRASSYCHQCLERAAAREDLPEERREDVRQAVLFLLESFPLLADETRQSVIATFNGIALPFCRSPFREIFGGETTLDLEREILENRRIIVVDYPIRDFSDIGRIVNGLIKYLFTAMVERRKVEESTLPVFLVADEYQELITRSDARFLATARESRALTLVLTQSLANLRSARGDGGKHEVDALLSTIVIRVACASSDADSNEELSRRIAKDWQVQTGSQIGSGQQGTFSASTNQSLQHVLEPIELTRLKTGGPPDWEVETIFFQGGRIFESSRQTFLRVMFPQRI